MEVSVGNRIKSLRELRGMTQKDLAALVGVHQSRISQCETGERGLSYELARKIAAALGVTTNDLSPENALGEVA